MKRPAFILLLTVVGASLPGAAVRATDEVTIRGAYYREASTRVIQPVVQIREDLPRGFDIQTHYLLDAITSASANAGAAADQHLHRDAERGRPRPGQELEADPRDAQLPVQRRVRLLVARVRRARSRSDFGATRPSSTSASGIAFDEASARGRKPFCANPPSRSCPLDTYFGGLSYTQVLSPVALAQVVAETAVSRAASRGTSTASVPGIGPELPPDRRLRNAVAARFGYYFPSA